MAHLLQTGGRLDGESGRVEAVEILAAERPRKIPAECPSCGRLLSREDMEKFLCGCEEAGDDPFEIAFANERHPGIQCARCFVRSIVEAAEDGNLAAKRFVLHARMEALGMRVVKA